MPDNAKTLKLESIPLFFFFKQIPVTSCSTSVKSPVEEPFDGRNATNVTVNVAPTVKKGRRQDRSTFPSPPFLFVFLVVANLFLSDFCIVFVLFLFLRATRPKVGGSDVLGVYPSTAHA